MRCSRRLALAAQHCSGYSIGGGIAYTYAGSRPDKLSRLVVVDNAPERTRSQTPEQAAATREHRDGESLRQHEECVAM